MKFYKFLQSHNKFFFIQKTKLLEIV